MQLWSSSHECTLALRAQSLAALNGQFCSALCRYHAYLFLLPVLPFPFFSTTIITLAAQTLASTGA